MQRHVLSGITAALLLASSAVAKPPPPMTLEEGSGDAVVYIYRRHLHTAWLPRGAAVEIDGRRVVKFPYNGCTAVRIPAGDHVVGVSWPPSFMSLDIGGQAPVEVAATLEPGGRHYFYLEVGLRTSTQQYAINEVFWSISQVDFQEAKVPLSKCYFVKPIAGWENTPVRPSRSESMVADRSETIAP